MSPYSLAVGIQKENMTKRFENTEAEHRDTNRPETRSNITEKQLRRYLANFQVHEITAMEEAGW